LLVIRPLTLALLSRAIIGVLALRLAGVLALIALADHDSTRQIDGGTPWY
jgi:hypothetical protein